MPACAPDNRVVSAVTALTALLLLVVTAAETEMEVPVQVKEETQTYRGHGARRHARSYEHLTGDTRHRKLFNYQRLFLRIDINGRVNGTRSRDDPYSVLEIRSVDVGVVAIRALSSNYYLAISSRGEVYGERVYGVNCGLVERIEENGYNTYSSAHWRTRTRTKTSTRTRSRRMFVALSSSGRPLRARRTNRKNTATHFLPILA